MANQIFIAEHSFNRKGQSDSYRLKAEELAKKACGQRTRHQWQSFRDSHHEHGDAHDKKLEELREVCHIKAPYSIRLDAEPDDQNQEGQHRHHLSEGQQ
jgi:hypothetical protein